MTAPSLPRTARTRTRCHPSTHPLLVRLNAEFDGLAGQPHTWHVVSTWGTECPVLRGCQTLLDVDDRLGRTQTGPDTDAALAYLISRGRNGDALAHRTVFQRMLGAAVHQATYALRDTTSRSPADRDEAIQLALAEMWDLIVDYPLARRPQRISGNLSMDLLRRVTSSARSARAQDRHESHELVEPDLDRQSETRHDEHLAVLQILAWGVDHEVISRDEARMLVRVYSPAPDELTGAALAEDLGLSWAALRKRCSRAVHALSDATLHTPAPAVPLAA